eukprot:UN04385
MLKYLKFKLKITSLLKLTSNSIESADDSLSKKKQKPVCLVYFLGGATYAEVAMLRFLSEKPSHKYTYIVATTKMTNAKHLINDLQYTTGKLGGSLE